MNQTTPGPWTFRRKYLDNSGSIIGADAKTVAAITSNGTRPAEEKLANARLIAAAPDLLDALKDAYEHIFVAAPKDDKESDRVLQVIKTAIAKATQA